jgi:hypothetical protein
MKSPATRLLVTVLLFAGWIGYLAYQVVTRPHAPNGQPLVVSRPQVLTSELDVVAEVPEGEGAVEVEIKEVLYPKKNAPVKVGDKLKVTNIAACHPPRGKDPPRDWTGPGAYLLPLKKGIKKGEYQVAPIPPSPGFGDVLFDRVLPGPPRIYLTGGEGEVLAQYRQCRKPELAE